MPWPLLVGTLNLSHQGCRFPCPPEVPTGVADAALLHGLHPPRNLEASLNSPHIPPHPAHHQMLRLLAPQLRPLPSSHYLPQPRPHHSFTWTVVSLSSLASLPPDSLQSTLQPERSFYSDPAILLHKTFSGAPTTYAERERDTTSWPAKTLHKPALCTNTQNEGPSQTQVPLTPPCFSFSIRTT